MPKMTRANRATATTGLRGADVGHGSSLLEQRHRFVCQHAAGDRDWSKWRLGRDLGARQHDLIDLGRELHHRRGKHQPLDVAPQDGAHAHRTRFARRVERTAAQGGWAVLSRPSRRARWDPGSSVRDCARAPSPRRRARRLHRTENRRGVPPRLPCA